MVEPSRWTVAPRPGVMGGGVEVGANKEISDVDR